MITKSKISKFQKKIWDFYGKNKRDFPWRKTTDAYKILVSEVMLQQTQVNRVIPKYQDFLRQFPKIEDLANAKNEDVLRFWSGLGYNRRALFLKNTAQIIHSFRSSRIVKLNQSGNVSISTHRDKNAWVKPEFLKTLPGIGVNTAGAIYVFSTNLPFVFIETNIRRVFIHEFFKGLKNPQSAEALVKEDKIHDKDILSLVELTLDKKNPREWYYALMDYGAYISKAEINPNRKSKHYSKQSRFEGSVRQTRGKILKTLLSKKAHSTQDLEKEINSQHFKIALDQLKKEGFIKSWKKKIILAD